MTRLPEFLPDQGSIKLVSVYGKSFTNNTKLRENSLLESVYVEVDILYEVTKPLSCLLSFSL